MTVKVIGLIELKDLTEFEKYRSEVGHTIELYKGKIVGRGTTADVFWNELACQKFGSYVELEFPQLIDAQTWAHSPEYQSLIKIRNKAMKVTLFSVAL